MTKTTNFIDYLLYFAIIKIYNMTGGDFLKNRLYIYVLIILVCILSSCGRSSSSSDTTTKSSADSSEAITTTSSTTQTTLTTTTPGTTTTNNTTTTKAPATTPKPATTPAPVVIPRVYVPTSPGQEVYTCASATVDVSNKSQGYFTVKYTGSNPMVKVLVKKDGSTYQYTLSTNGSIEVFPLPLGSGTYNIGIYEQVSGSSYSVALQQDVSINISNSLSPFLYPNQQVNFSQGSACVTRSAQVCAGKNSDVEKVSAIFKYVTDNIKYDQAEANAIINGSLKNYCPNPDEVLSTRKGICYDYASLMAAMCRAQGIPTKLVKGYVGSDGLYHAWNQVYLNNEGWITVEFKARAGFNTVDATFYAGSSNKGSVTANFTNASYYKVYQVF